MRELVNMPLGQAMVISSDMAGFIAFAVPAAVVIVLRRYPVAAIMVGIALLIPGCELQYRAVDRECRGEMQRIQHLPATGVQPMMDELLFDGTGDRVAVIMAGWIPGAIGVGFGFATRYAVGRFMERRSRPQPRGAGKSSRPAGRTSSKLDG